MRVLYVVTLLVVFNSIWSCNIAESGCAVERGTAKATAGFLTAPQLAEVDFVGPICALLRSTSDCNFAATNQQYSTSLNEKLTRQSPDCIQSDAES
jgi:hypothetical protein